jgi:sterol desaturase/sphingolipid hydroxylase (fatty acid hydroxylase superfamily)
MSDRKLRSADDCAGADAKPASGASSGGGSGVSGGGFSPRMHPRPQYPGIGHMLLSLGKETFWQSGMLGLVLTLAVFPFYGQLVLFLRTRLGAYGYGTDQAVFAVVANLVHFLAYTVINGSFGLFDYFGLLQEYKLSRRAYMKPSGKLLLSTLLQAGFGQLVINPLALYYLYPSLVSLGMSGLDAPLPDNLTMFLTFCRAYLVNGIGFYFAHRAFHTKAIYAYAHKQHHEYSGSMGIAAEYANPLEQVFANMLPTLGGVVFWGTHPLVFCVWLFMRLQQTYETHSGYSFKHTALDRLGLAHADAAVHHDYHHAVNTGNFGTEWMDWIFGTEDFFVAGGMHEGYMAKKSSSSKKA